MDKQLQSKGYWGPSHYNHVKNADYSDKSWPDAIKHHTGLCKSNPICQCGSNCQCGNKCSCLKDTIPSLEQFGMDSIGKVCVSISMISSVVVLFLILKFEIHKKVFKFIKKLIK